jgi:uncharacterized protein YbjT (DUF2867 family)
VQQRQVLVLGATGPVGRELLRLLLDDPAVGSVGVIVRRTTGVTSPKLAEHVLELDDMEQRPELFAVDAIFCALGTTMKAAGSAERFRLVDHLYPLNAARLGRAQGAEHYLLVSSVGADPASRAFYLRVKGDVERDILLLGYPRTTIARPSLLLGARDEFRLGERLFAVVGRLAPPAYRPVHAADVARALVAAAHARRPGVEILESRALRARRR